MGRIIDWPYPKTWIDLLIGKPMLNKLVWWIGIRNFTYLSWWTWYLKINGCCQSKKVDQNITCIGFKPQWVDAHVNNFLTIQARELKFCVCYLREKYAHLTNFQHNSNTTSKVSDFGHFICRVSSPIVPPSPSFPHSPLHRSGMYIYIGSALWNICRILRPAPLGLKYHRALCLGRQDDRIRRISQASNVKEPTRFMVTSWIVVSDKGHNSLPK